MGQAIIAGFSKTSLTEQYRTGTGTFSERPRRGPVTFSCANASQVVQIVKNRHGCNNHHPDGGETCFTDQDKSVIEVSEAAGLGTNKFCVDTLPEYVFVITRMGKTKGRSGYFAAEGIVFRKKEPYYLHPQPKVVRFYKSNSAGAWKALLGLERDKGRLKIIKGSWRHYTAENRVHPKLSAKLEESRIKIGPKQMPEWNDKLWHIPKGVREGSKSFYSFGRFQAEVQRSNPLNLSGGFDATTVKKMWDTVGDRVWAQSWLDDVGHPSHGLLPEWVSDPKKEHNLGDDDLNHVRDYLGEFDPDNKEYSRIWQTLLAKFAKPFGNELLQKYTITLHDDDTLEKGGHHPKLGDYTLHTVEFQPKGEGKVHNVDSLLARFAYNMKYDVLWLSWINTKDTVTKNLVSPYGTWRTFVDVGFLQAKPVDYRRQVLTTNLVRKFLIIACDKNKRFRDGKYESERISDTLSHCGVEDTRYVLQRFVLDELQVIKYVKEMIQKKKLQKEMLQQKMLPKEMLQQKMLPKEMLQQKMLQKEMLQKKM